MNKQDLETFRNSVLRSIVNTLGVKRNVIIISLANSWQHEMVKARICYELQKQGMHYITEPRVFIKHRKEARPDILILDTAMAVEILVSETEDEVKYKTRNYPDTIQVVSVKAWSDLFDGTYQIIKQKLL